jgi:hypothetical protein
VKQNVVLGVLLPTMAVFLFPPLSCHGDSCANFRQSRVDELSWERITKRGAVCLSPQESEILNRSGTQVLLGLAGGKTVGELIQMQKEIEQQAEHIVLPNIGSAENPGAEPPPSANHLNLNIQRSPVFIYGSDVNGQAIKGAALATGFFVWIPAKDKRNIRLFITARHVIDRRWADCPGESPRRIFLRFNTTNFDPATTAEGVAYEPLDVSEKTFFTPSNEHIDVAVSVVTPKSMPNLDLYDVGYVPISLFATPGELKQVREGDQIITAGLVPAAAGVKRNYPFLTLETVSSLPKELSTAFCTQGANAKTLKIWWLSGQGLNPGRSGSPIFEIQRRTYRNQLRSGPVLVGIQSMSNQGAGVAGVTDSDDLYDAIREATKDIPGLDMQRGFH